jgi:VanZ family protein
MSEADPASKPNALWKLLWYWLPPLLWMGILFYLSAQPDLPGPPDPWWDRLFKKSAHFGMYAMLAFWWWRALNSRRTSLPDTGTSRTRLIAAFLIAVVYGISDEIHQGFVPGRNPSPTDVFIDAAGAATALGLVWRWKRTKREKLKRNGDP